MTTGDLLDVLGSISAGQWGLVTAAQATQEGVAAVELRRACARGLIRRVRHGVYAMPGARADHLEEIRAEWLATNPGRRASQRRLDDNLVVVSDDSAARVYGIGDMPSGGVHLTAARRLRPAANTSVQPHRRQLDPREIVWVDGLPVTSVRRTLEDIAGRWEESHLRDAVEDAIRAGLMPARQIAKSSKLIALVPDLAPPTTHAGLKQRLKNVPDGTNSSIAYDDFFRLQFLGALGRHPGWVLKGGTNLLFRLENARATRDLDLFLNDPAGAMATADRLVALMDGAQVGRYTFRLGEIHAGREGGHVDMARTQVRVFDDTQQVNVFNIDVSDAVALTHEPARHVLSTSPVPVPGYLTRISFVLYPVENQLADKLCAMYQDYGQGPSTRYHDLYDAAMIVSQLPIDVAELRAALAIQYERRRMRVPASLSEPTPGWANRYNRELPKIPGTKPPFTDYDAATEALRGRIGPALAP